MAVRNRRLPPAARWCVVALGLAEPDASILVVGEISFDEGCVDAAFDEGTMA